MHKLKSGGEIMADVMRISPVDAKQQIEAGKALLVCAYQDDGKFQNNHLEGALSHSDFLGQLKNLPMDQEIVFYCAWPNEASAAGLAEKYLSDGFVNATVLGGGVDGWKQAGYPLN